jgi:HSP20 family protein
MSMMLREPLEAITPLRDVMNRLLEESFIGPERLDVSAARAFPLDISESDDKQQYIIEANMAGFKPEEIEVIASENTLTIRAAKKEESKTQKAGYLRRERYVGEMSRTVTLPSHIDADKIQATCDQGILMLRVPKAAEAKTKQIPVKAKGH